MADEEGSTPNKGLRLKKLVHHLSKLEIWPLTNINSCLLPNFIIFFEIAKVSVATVRGLGI